MTTLGSGFRVQGSGCLPRTHNPEPRTASRMGYSIIEYLLVAAAAAGAVWAIQTAVAWKTLEVSVNEINKVNDGIPWE